MQMSPTIFLISDIINIPDPQQGSMAVHSLDFIDFDSKKYRKDLARTHVVGC